MQLFFYCSQNSPARSCPIHLQTGCFQTFDEPCLLALHGNTQVSTKWLVTTSWSNAPLHSLHQLRTHSKLNSARILVHGCCPQQPLHGREPPLCTCQEEQGFQKDQNGYSYIPADNYKHLGLNFQDLTSVKNLVNPFSLFCSLTC